MSVLRAVSLHFSALAAILLAAGSSLAQNAGDWPRWRGPQDAGSSEIGRGYPVEFNDTDGVLWRAALPGKGSSTPIVFNQRIYLTAPLDGQDAVLAFDLAGKPLWQTALGPQREGLHRNGSSCNPSPVTDGRGLFVYFKSGRLAALDLDGTTRWQTNLQERFGKDTLFWDIGTSPALTRDDVVVAVMHHGNSYLAAFDRKTGRLHWKVDRNYETPVEGDHSYTTPIVLEHQGREALLIWGGQHLTLHDAADGRTLWSCGDFNPDSKDNWVAVGSPVVAGQMVVVPYGRGERLHGIRLGGNGDVTASHRAWRRDDTGSFVTTPAYWQGRVYLLRDRGVIERIDPASGKTLASVELPRRSSNFYASPTVVDGKLYAAREDGVVFVVAIDSEPRILAENDMGQRLIATPVPTAGRLLIRGEKDLFCIGSK